MGLKEVLKQKTMQNMKAMVLSKNFTLHSPLLLQELGETKPNINETKYYSEGYDGVYGTNKKLEDYPASFTASMPNPVANYLAMIVKDNDPYAKDLDKHVIDGFETGHSIDVILYEYDKGELKGTIVYFDCEDLQHGHNLPISDGISSVSVDGTAKRVFTFVKPLYFEGWGTLLTVAPSDTPDDSILIDSTAHDRLVYLRLSTGTYTPRRAYLPVSVSMPSFLGIDSLTRPAQGDESSNNFAVDVLVAYETGSGPEDIDIMVINGAGDAGTMAGATPTSAEISSAISGDSTNIGDAAIETALGSGVRWCKLAHIIVTEETATPVVVNEGDIIQIEQTSCTLNETALAVPEKKKADSWFWDDYAVALKLDGVFEQALVSDFTMTSSDITLSTGRKCVEVAYNVDSLDYADMPCK